LQSTKMSKLKWRSFESFGDSLSFVDGYFERREADNVFDEKLDSM